jgi:hypothetical protein
MGHPSREKGRCSILDFTHDSDIAVRLTVQRSLGMTILFAW